jgi:uncharacterized protein
LKEKPDISRELIAAIRLQYVLPWNGCHGVGHWARVRENGLRIAASTPGVNIQVVELFAVFHDSRRQNEGWDHGHGRRGGKLARALRGTLFEISDAELELLCTACDLHTDGHTQAEPTIQACWDADRLDLARVGTMPNPKYLCTPAAKDPEMIRWADERACRWFVPQFAIENWFADPGGYHR